MDYNDSNNFVVLFGSIKKKIYKILSDKIKEYDISLPEGLYLIMINEQKDGISFKDLTKKADCDKGMTTRVVNSLESKGLVISEIINNKRIIILTDKGIIFSKNIHMLLEEFKNNILKKIDNKKLKEFYDTLYNFNILLEGEIKC